MHRITAREITTRYLTEIAHLAPYLVRSIIHKFQKALTISLIPCSSWRVLRVWNREAFRLARFLLPVLLWHHLLGLFISNVGPTTRNSTRVAVIFLNPSLAHSQFPDFAKQQSSLRFSPLPFLWTAHQLHQAPVSKSDKTPLKGFFYTSVYPSE